jgi:uncharacterized protein (TIGR02996 family)
VNLEQALDLWRRSRDRRAGDLAVILAAEEHPPRKLGTTVTAQTEAWLALDEKKTDADLPTLIASLGVGRWQRVHERLERVERWPASPLVGRGLVGMLAAVPFPGQQTLPMWQRLLLSLPRHADAAMIEDLERLGARKWPGSARMQKIMKDAIAGALTTVRAVKMPPPLEESEAKALVAVHRTAKPAISDEELLAAVLANPADDGPREIYRDHLLEKGDPRGELIALQMSGAGPKKVASLLRSHRKTWLGPLAPIAAACTFERGFVASIDYKAKYVSALKTLTGEPTWATVRTIRFVDWHTRDVAKFLAHPIMRSLREVWGLYPGVVQQLGETERAKDLEVLGFYDDAASTKIDFGRFTRLRELAIQSRAYRPQPFSWLQQDRELLGRLERLVVQNGDASVPTWLPAVRVHAKKLKTLIIEPTHDPASGLLRHTLTRGPSGALDTLVISRAEHDYDPTRAFREAVARLPPDEKLSVELVFPDSMPEVVRAELRARLG